MSRKPTAVSDERKKAVMAFIVGFSEEHRGIPPTIREIAKATDLSLQAVIDNVYSLEREGKLKRAIRLGARNITVVGATWCPPRTEGMAAHD